MTNEWILEGKKTHFISWKISVTLFAPDTKEFNIQPQVSINNTIVPLERNPRLLGVDTMLTFNPHVNNTINKAKSKNNLMKTVAGHNWEQSKKC